MITRLSGCLAGFMFALGASTAQAQEPPLTLYEGHAIRIVTGANITGRYEEGDTFRIGVLVNTSTQPTTVTTSRAGTEITVPYYQNAVLDDLYEVRLPFDPAFVGPWTLVVTRGAETAATEAAGLPALFPVPLLEGLDVARVDGRAVVSWTWPDVSAAQALGLRVEADVRVMQYDNYDDFLIRYGVHPSLIPPGAPGDRYEVTIPDGLEGDKLFLFRVHLSFYGADGRLVAQSITFAPQLYATPL